MNIQVEEIWGKVCGKGRGAPIPSLGTPPSKHLHLFNDPEAPQTPYFWNFLKTELDYNNSKISRIEWNPYLTWYFEATKHYQEPKIVSSAKQILGLTEAKKNLKR